MQFDRTRIAIRERPFLDIVDLSFQVLRSFLWPLFLTTLVVALPIAVIDWWLLRDLIREELELSLVIRYVWLLTMLVFLQAPLVSAVGTTYLGNALFYASARPKDLWKDARGTLPRLLLLQGILRGVLPGMLVLLLVDPMDNLSPVEFFFMPALCFVAIGFRAFRPYLNEIVLLEKCPLRSRGDNSMSIAKRSSALHRFSSGELLGRWVIATFLSLLLVLSLFGSLFFVASLFLGGDGFQYLMWYVGLPLAMWLTAMYFTVVRFLGYLDLRIRREGWEVELQIRTVGARLAEQLS